MAVTRTIVAVLSLLLAAQARADLIDVIVDGTVVTNDVQVGPYVGIAPGAPVRLTVQVDTTDIFSDEPENFTTWYHVDYTLARFNFPGTGIPVAAGEHNGVFSDSVVAFSGGNVYHQVDIPAIYFLTPVLSIVHCQFDGVDDNPFNNTGHIEENLGTWPSGIFERTRYFIVSVLHPHPTLPPPFVTFRDMWFEAQTFTFVEAGGGCAADWDASGAVDSSDFFAFLADFLAGAAEADINGSGTTDSSDFFAFLAAFFTGC